MEIVESKYFKLTESSQVSEVRITASSMASDTGFSDAITGNIAIVASEIANNIVKHTDDGGEIFIQHLKEENLHSIEIIAIDKGPGMVNVDACMEDGYSSKNSKGIGLGAIKRLSDEFDIYSTIGDGTILISRTCNKNYSKNISNSYYEMGGLKKNIKLEKVCGDNWFTIQKNGKLSLILSDGLGHGDYAFKATSIAIEVFKQHYHKELEELMQMMHSSLKATRGAAIATAEIDVLNEKLLFLGNGNVSGTLIYPEKNQRTLSNFGTVGHNISSTKKFHYHWKADSIFIIHSDGIKIDWHLQDQPEIKFKHPSLLAAYVYSQFARTNDDVSLLVIKNKTKLYAY